MKASKRTKLIMKPSTRTKRNGVTIISGSKRTKILIKKDLVRGGLFYNPSPNCPSRCHYKGTEVTDVVICHYTCPQQCKNFIDYTTKFPFKKSRGEPIRIQKYVPKKQNESEK